MKKAYGLRQTAYGKKMEALFGRRSGIRRNALLEVILKKWPTSVRGGFSAPRKSGGE
jgi:hypothetical protein